MRWVLTGSLSGDAFEDIVDERVEDGHSLVRDTSIRVDLLEDWDITIRDKQVDNPAKSHTLVDVR
jgi:hypothetical protein